MFVDELTTSGPNGPIAHIIEEKIPPINEDVKNVYSVPWLSFTYGLFNAIFSLLFNNVVIAPTIRPIKIAGKGSGFKFEVAPYAIPPYCKINQLLWKRKTLYHEDEF